jgi:cyanate permease
MIGAVGWRQSLDLLAIGSLIVIVPLVVAVIRNYPGAGDSSARHGPMPEAPKEKEFTAKAILRERNFWGICLFIIPVVACLGGFQANFAAYATERGFTQMEGGSLFSLMALMLLAAKFVWGYLADRVEHRILFVFAAVLSAVAYVAIGLTSGYTAIAASVMFLGLAAGGILPLMGATFSHTFGRSFGRAFGLMGLFMPVASGGAPAVAWLQERLDSYTPAMFALAALVLLSGAAALLLRRRRA